MISIDKTKCIGCGACAAVCESVFEMKGDKAQVKKGKEKLKDSCVKDAIDSCPVNAIKI